MNLFAGSVAVIFALKGWSTWAVFLIMAAAIFDFLDGFAARLLKAYSPIGKELDSLADMVSFGLAPSLLLYYRYSQSLSPYISGDISSISFELLTFFPLIIAVFSGLRLAKFNVDIRQSENFIGLPTQIRLKEGCKMEQNPSCPEPRLQIFCRKEYERN